MSEQYATGPGLAVIAHVIGQTPRPDLSNDLQRRFPSTRFRVVGALDGLRPGELPPLAHHGYPLETLLRGGDRVVVDADFVAPLLQDAIEANDAGASAHLILCAGPFEELVVPTKPSGHSTPLIRPFDVGVAECLRCGHHRLALLVPFAAQAAPARKKWTGAGFSAQVHVLADRPKALTIDEWVSNLVGESDADVLVFDYVGFPSEVLEEVAARVEIPVFDLGHLALDELDKVLSAL